MRDYDDELVIVGLGVIAVWQDDTTTAFVRASVGFRRDPRLREVFMMDARQARDWTPDGRDPRDEHRDGEKYCLACGEWKSVDDYTPKDGARDGLHPYCKACRARMQREKRAVTGDVTQLLDKLSPRRLY